jgi:hypothetical protein
MTLSAMIRRPSAFVPMLMSLAALSIVLIFLALHGPAPQEDEGAAAHLWQLLVVCQLPIIAFFAVKWVPEAPRQAIQVMAMQLVAGVAAIAPVFLLHW